MKAIVYSKYGNIENLSLAEVANPLPKDNEVLIRNYAMAINDWDFDLLRGDFINRLINGLFKPKRTILGSDIAGRIEAVGKHVTKFNVGDEVYGDLSGNWGGFAEYSCASENALALKPANMSFVEAAAIPQAAMLAVQGLIDIGKIKSGQRLLINGAGGGVGTFALQIAKTYGLEVTGVDRAGKLDMMKALGFDHVLDYKKTDFTNNGLQYDIILDVKTNRLVFDYLRVLNPKGIYVTVGGSMLRILQVALVGPLISKFTKKHVRIVALKPNKDLGYINDLYNGGKIKPVVEGPYVFSDFAEAFSKFNTSEHKGKVVITIDSK